MRVLDRIFAAKRQQVAEAKARLPLTELKSRVADAPATRAFRGALAESPRAPALIAEIKKASPSRGLIRPDLDPTEVARAYSRAGAQALSVLTESVHFQGSAKNLVLARAAVDLPVLRKDFLDDPYQIYEARAWGADAVLLIVAAIEPAQLRDLQDLARELRMDALVEVHNAEEAQIALDAGSDLVGINNRNLADLKTDLGTTEALAPMLLGRALVVSESALRGPKDVRRVTAAGARAVLIGTEFCASPDIEGAVRRTMGWT